MAYTKNKQSFVIYESFYDAAMHLNDEEFREYMLRLKDYAIYGMEEESENKMINGLMAMAMPLLDAAEKRRKAKVENGQKGAEYGSLGGRPRKGETAEEYRLRKQQEQNASTKTATETPNETANKGLNVNANEDAKVNADVEADANGNADEDANAEGKDAAESRDESQSNVFNLTDLVRSYQGSEDTRELEKEMKGPQREVISDDSKNNDLIYTKGSMEGRNPLSSKGLNFVSQAPCVAEEPRGAAEPTKTERELSNEVFNAGEVMARYDRRQATQDEYSTALNRGIQAMMILNRLTRDEAKSVMMDVKKLILEGRV